MKPKIEKTEKKQGLDCRLLLGLTSLIASSSIASSPTFAAISANSEAEFELFNLSHFPDTTDVSTDINSFTIAFGGIVKDSTDSNALFLSQGKSTSSNSSSSAFGNGSNYLGKVLSEAEVRGTFSLEAGESFSFDFVSFLDIATSIENFQTESAIATGDLSFLLLDTTDSNNVTVLDKFLLFGNLSSPSKSNTSDFLNLENSDNFTLTKNLQTTAFGGNKEIASASVEGSFERFFALPTNLTLIEVQTNHVSVEARLVEVPESNFNYSYLVLSGAFALKQIFLRSDRKI